MYESFLRNVSLSIVIGNINQYPPTNVNMRSDTDSNVSQILYNNNKWLLNFRRYLENVSNVVLVCNGIKTIKRSNKMYYFPFKLIQNILSVNQVWVCLRDITCLINTKTVTFDFPKTWINQTSTINHNPYIKTWNIIF